jgi:hypothetical protein
MAQPTEVQQFPKFYEQAEKRYKNGRTQYGVLIITSGLYYKCVTIVIDPPSVVKVMLQIVASLTIVIDDARLRLS